MDYGEQYLIAFRAEGNRPQLSAGIGRAFASSTPGWMPRGRISAPEILEAHHTATIQLGALNSQPSTAP